MAGSLRCHRAKPRDREAKLRGGGTAEKKYGKARSRQSACTVAGSLRCHRAKPRDREAKLRGGGTAEKRQLCAEIIIKFGR